MKNASIAATMIAAILLAAPVTAQIVDLTAEVDGLTCMFCAFSLEKSLTKLDGVARAAIDIATGTAVLTPATDKSIDANAVPDAVDDAGFTLRGIQVHAKGAIEDRDGGMALVAPNGSILFRLANNSVLQTVRPADGGTYTVTGTIVIPAKGKPKTTPPELVLTEIGSGQEGR